MSLANVSGTLLISPTTSSFPPTFFQSHSLNSRLWKIPLNKSIYCFGNNVSSARPRKRMGSKTRNDASEAEELIASLMKNFNTNNPSELTMNKYAKFIRTEHCFMLFEELGKTGKWLQCLEVSSTSFINTIWNWKWPFS